MPKDKNMPYNDWESIMDDPTTSNVALAIQSLEKGTASPEQQKFFLDFLIRIGCRTYDTDWFPAERISCFAAGRRYVGQQIVRFINLKIGKLKNG
jgi:hypothetical protein